MMDAQTLLRRRRALWVAAGCVAPFVPLGALLPNELAGVCAAVSWLVVLIWAAWAQRPERPLLANASAMASIAVGAAQMVWQVIVSGGSLSTFRGLLLALPLGVLIAFPDLWYSVIVAGALTVAGGVTVQAWSGRPIAETAFWICLVVGSTAMAGLGARLVRQDHARQLAAERARASALEALAQSEGRRLRAERLAGVARLAGRVSHEVNNPLATLRSNLRWMSDEGHAAPPDEAAAALRDTIEAVDQMVVVMADLRRESVAAMKRASEDLQQEPDGGAGEIASELSK
jgi:signal transduction histidine kinase